MYRAAGSGEFARSYHSETNLISMLFPLNSQIPGGILKTISQINYPGTSPHQTGRAIDFGDKSGKLTSQSPAYKWLVSNASRFGFYHHQLEPEHWNYKP